MKTVWPERAARVTVLLSALLACCGGGPEDITGGPLVSVIDSMRLEETDSLFLARPVSLAIDERDGSILVSDVASGRVVRFAPDGSVLGTYGSPGRGPGELSAPGAVFLARGTVVVEDFRSRTFEEFDTADGRHVRSTGYAGQPTYYAESRFSDTAWIGIRDPITQTVVAAWALDGDTVRHVVAMPGEYAEFGGIGIGRITGLPVVHWADTLLVGFGPLSGVVALSLTTGRTDSLEIPVRMRRGVTRRAIQDAGVDFVALMNGISALNAVHRMPSGEVALVHYDHYVEGERAPRITAQLYVSLLDRGLREACVDTPVPLSSDGRPVVQFHGDTLLVLHQEVDEVTSTASAWLSRFLVSAAGCRWLLMPRGEPLLR